MDIEQKKTDLKEAFISKKPESEPEEETMYTRRRRRNKIILN